MDKLNLDDRGRTAAEADSHAQEAAMIAKADADIASGLYVDADEVDAWIDSIGTDRELPPPTTRHA